MTLSGMNKQGGEQQGFVATLFVHAFIVILLCKHKPWLVAKLGRKKKTEIEEEGKKKTLPEAVVLQRRSFISNNDACT